MAALFMRTLCESHVGQVLTASVSYAVNKPVPKLYNHSGSIGPDDLAGANRGSRSRMMSSSMLPTSVPWRIFLRAQLLRT